MIRKTKSTIRVYALKSDDDPKTKSTIRSLCLTSDDGHGKTEHTETRNERISGEETPQVLQKPP